MEYPFRFHKRMFIFIRQKNKSEKSRLKGGFFALIPLFLLKKKHKSHDFLNKDTVY